MKKGVTMSLAAALVFSSTIPAVYAEAPDKLAANDKKEDEKPVRPIVDTLTLQDAIKYGMESDFSLMEIEYAIEELKITEDQVDDNYDDVDDALEGLQKQFQALEAQLATEKETTTDSATVDSASVKIDNFDKKIKSLVDVLALLSDEEVQKIMNNAEGAGDPAAVLKTMLINIELFMKEYKVLEQSTEQKLSAVREQIYTLTQTYESLESTLEQLDISLRSTYNSRSKMFQAIPISITSSYFSILKAQDQLALTKASYTNEQKTLKAAQVKFELGMLSKKDYDKAIREFSDLEKNIALLEKNLNNSKKTFALTIGIAYNDDYQLVKPQLTDVQLLTQTVKTEDLITKNFDMVSAEYNLRIAEENLDYVEDKDNASKDEEKQAKLGIEKAKLAITKLENNLQKTIETTFFQVEAQYKAVQDAAQALQVAKDEVADIQVYYDLGIISKIQYEASSLMVQQAEMAYTNALLDYYMLEKKVEAMYEGVII
ncbi:MAG: TolC family protein [Solibacillus sp.]